MRSTAAICWTVLASICSWGFVAPALAVPVRPASERPSAPRSDVVEATELPEPFIPKLSRTEADADRLEALQLYAAGRLKEQQQQLPAALQFYQRAYRRDPAAVTVLKQIIPLAFNLGRSEEAFRYALKLGEAEPNDPVLLRQLGVHLAGEGKLTEAVSFYEQAWKLERERGKRAPSTVLLLAQLGKMYLIDQRPAQAADVYAEVISAFEKPDEYKLDKRSRQLVLDDAAKTLEMLGIDTGERGEEASAFELFGRAFLEAGRLDQAQMAFERAHAVKPDEGLNGWYRAQLAAARGEHGAAIAALDAYFKAHRTSHGLAPYQLLERELGKLEKQNQLIEQLTALVAADPSNDLLRYFLAERYRAAEQFDKAEPLYAQLAKEKPSLDVYQAQVDLYRRTRNVPALLQTLATSLAQLRQIELLGDEGKALLADEALVDELLAAALPRLTEDATKFPVAERAGLGSLALSAKRFEPAAQLFESAVVLDPAEARDLLRRWGLGLLMQDRPADAVAVFTRVPQGETPTAKAQRLYHLAGALELEGKSDEALQAAREAAELAEAEREQLEEAYYSIISRVPWVLFHAKRYDAAREAYAAQLARFEKQLDNKAARASAREARLMLSNLSALQDDMLQAEEWLEQILDEAPDDISAANDLGYIWVDQASTWSVRCG